jgi:hypothetical protein
MPYRNLRTKLFAAALLVASVSGHAWAETPRAEYLKPLTPDNAAFLFIDNQTKLMMAVQSIDHTRAHAKHEGLARLAAVFKSPVVLTTTGGGANGPAGALYPAITETFPNVPVIDRMLYFNAMSDKAFADAVKKTGRRRSSCRASRPTTVLSIRADAHRAGLPRLRGRRRLGLLDQAG